MTRLNPEWTDPTGLTLYRSMQHRGALAMLRQAEQHNPEHAEYWRAVAVAFASA